MLLLQKDTLLTASQLKAKVREAWQSCQCWVGADPGLKKDHLPGMDLTIGVGVGG